MVKNGSGGSTLSLVQQYGNSPVMLLAKLRPGTDYVHIKEWGEPHCKMFTLSVTVDGRTFEGTG